MIRLGVNIDHVATVRQARRAKEPDPVAAAVLATLGGADGITVHLREDRRHIQDRDVRVLRDTVPVRLNLELAAAEEIIAIATRIKPDVVTLVPERREERTTEGGLDVVRGGDALAARVKALLGEKIKVSLFIAADDAQVRASKHLGVAQIELHTGEYAHAKDAREVHAELDRLRAAARLGYELGLQIAAGHGLTTANVPALVGIQEIAELNIGHAVIADAVFLSLAGAVRAMRDAIHAGRP